MLESTVASFALGPVAFRVSCRRYLGSELAVALRTLGRMGVEGGVRLIGHGSSAIGVTGALETFSALQWFTGAVRGRGWDWRSIVRWSDGCIMQVREVQVSYRTISGFV